jgi:two-component system, chemotaxis family, CheB/CheR fusion protein
LKKTSGHPRITKVATKTVASGNPPVKPFPIVGFGASAGGLEAFSDILTHLSEDLGMAYILVMHLSPNHKSALAEILQLKTKMRVNTVKNGMEVKANNIYVIPPNTSMSIVDGHLKLAPRDITANGNFAIDYFLTALASVYKNNSIGVILSGTATDGTLGLKAIKSEGGITFAQDNSAKFPSMPKNAYESGYADFILPPDSIAKELADLAKTSGQHCKRAG